MKFDIQLFGGRGVSSSEIHTKKTSFTTAIGTDASGKFERKQIPVNGIAFKYKTINVGIYNKSLQEIDNISTPGRGEAKYVAVVLTDNDVNGSMIATGKTRKEAIQNTKNIIDEKKKETESNRGK